MKKIDEENEKNRWIENNGWLDGQKKMMDGWVGGKIWIAGWIVKN